MSLSSAWPFELAQVAAILKRADALASALDRSRWDFAVSIGELSATGVTQADLRWLVCRGLVEHTDEMMESAGAVRAFRATPSLQFTARTCFVLTAIGHNSLPESLTDSRHPGQDDRLEETAIASDKADVPTSDKMDSAQLKPQWNSDLGRLLLGEVLVKQFRRFAANQNLILSVFQEEDWPLRIDDPLPRVGHIEPKQRLHEAIAGLNRLRANPVLRFSRDGTGEGVKWAACHFKK